MPRPVIIDTDPGVDDILAIFLAIASPELDLIGLTSVYGNVTGPRAADNARRLLDIAGQSHLPVAEGAGAPMVGAPIGPVGFIHGENGLGDVALAAPSRPHHDLDAAQFMIAEALARPGEITIIAIGPLTNLANAVALHPSLPSLIREVVIMGGNAYCGGNASAAAEANILNDPEAADVVFAQDWPLTMVGLDITDTTTLSPANLERIASGGGPTHRFMGAATPFYQRFYEQAIPGYQGLRPHDAVAVAYLIDPELFETVDRPVAVGLTGIGRGKTWPAEPHHIQPGTPWVGRRAMTLCVGGDSAGIDELITKRLAAPITP